MESVTNQLTLTLAQTYPQYPLIGCIHRCSIQLIFFLRFEGQIQVTLGSVTRCRAIVNCTAQRYTLFLDVVSICTKLMRYTELHEYRVYILTLTLIKPLKRSSNTPYDPALHEKIQCLINRGYDAQIQTLSNHNIPRNECRQK
jgi:hypothetical protein